MINMNQVLNFTEVTNYEQFKLNLTRQQIVLNRSAQDEFKPTTSDDFNPRVSV